MRGALAAAWRLGDERTQAWRNAPRWRPLTQAPAAPGWDVPHVQGRFVEIAGRGAQTRLTFAFTLLRDAQRRAEPAAWIALSGSAFFPPDAAAAGVNLRALPVVFAPEVDVAARAADRLLRSGGFGLVVLDLTGAVPRLSPAAQSRLAGLAQQQGAVFLCLTDKTAHAPSLGSLVSLRLQARRQRLGNGRFTGRLEALKDKRHGPGWSAAETFLGPAGLS